MTKPFENQVVLVTGATAGIGRAAAIAFARQGAKLVVSGRNAEAGSKLDRAQALGVVVIDEAQLRTLIDS